MFRSWFRVGISTDIRIGGFVGMDYTLFKPYVALNCSKPARLRLRGLRKSAGLAINRRRSTRHRSHGARLTSMRQLISSGGTARPPESGQMHR
jgi:hypothetical protein